MELGRGLRTPQVCKTLGISEQTYSRGRKEYGGLRLDQAKRLQALERENTQLKKLVGTRRSTTRFSKRCPRETAEPAPTPAGGGARPPPVARVGEAGVSRDRPRAVDPSRDQAMVPVDEPRLGARMIALATRDGRDGDRRSTGLLCII